jgi:hypothetical protein
MIENYTINPDGIIHQIDIVDSLQTYDIDYVNTRYNTYGELGMQMAFYRLGYLLGNLKYTPKSVLDIGYGNGDFLKACSTIIPECYGNDITNYQLPHSVQFIDDIFSKHFDVITFFDVLEHFEDIEFVKNLKCDYVFISLPWCHYFSDEWFENWKHRRPDEHLWHFDSNSLISFFDRMGFDLISISNMEDAIRKDHSAIQNKYSNILSGVFKKRI